MTSTDKKSAGPAQEPTLSQVGLKLMMTNKFFAAEKLFKENPTNSRLQLLQCHLTFLKAVAAESEQDIADALTLTWACEKLGKKQADSSSSSATGIEGRLIQASTHLLGSMTQFIQQSNAKGAWNLRKSFKHFQAAAKEIAKFSGPELEDLAGWSEFGLGFFNLMVSLLPPSVVTIAEWVGFEGKREQGISNLLASQQRDEKSPQGSFMSAFSGILLLSFYLTISVFTGEQTPKMLDQAEQLLQWAERRYPDGIMFSLLESRLHRARTRLRKAISVAHTALGQCAELPSLAVLLHYQKGWCAFILGHWAEAAAYFDQLIYLEPVPGLVDSTRTTDAKGDAKADAKAESSAGSEAKAEAKGDSKELNGGGSDSDDDKDDDDVVFYEDAADAAVSKELEAKEAKDKAKKAETDGQEFKDVDADADSGAGDAPTFHADDSSAGSAGAGAAAGDAKSGSSGSASSAEVDAKAAAERAAADAKADAEEDKKAAARLSLKVTLKGDELAKALSARPRCVSAKASVQAFYAMHVGLCYAALGEWAVAKWYFRDAPTWLKTKNPDRPMEMYAKYKSAEWLDPKKPERHEDVVLDVFELLYAWKGFNQMPVATLETLHAWLEKAAASGGSPQATWNFLGVARYLVFRAALLHAQGNAKGALADLLKVLENESQLSKDSAAKASAVLPFTHLELTSVYISLKQKDKAQSALKTAAAFSDFTLYKPLQIQMHALRSVLAKMPA